MSKMALFADDVGRPLRLLFKCTKRKCKINIVVMNDTWETSEHASIAQ